MPQTVAQLPVCSECGSEALGQALFCFHCGARLEVGKSGDAGNDADSASESILPEVDKPIEPPSGDPFGSEDEKKQGAKPTRKRKKEAASDPIAKTASAIRQGQALTRMRRIETRWSPDDDSPNVWFIVASLVLFLAALGFFLVSMYLR